MPAENTSDLHYVHRDKAPASLNSGLVDLTTDLIAEANRRHDAARHEVSMWVKAHYPHADWERIARGRK